MDAMSMEAVVVPAINHLLRQEPWARDRLRPFTGKTVSITVEPITTLRLRVRADGLLERGATEAATDLSMSIAARSIASLLNDKAALLKGARIEGDVEFASAVQAVARGLRWDVEDDLARVIGDVAAHRVAQTGASVIGWQREATDRLARNVAEYVTYETRLAASRGEIADFSVRNDSLTRRLDALDARIELLESRIV
jgi:ubiquinone biosynthesis accessory factor UbiJ